MQGTNRAHDHDQTRVARRVTVALVAIAILALAQPALGARSATTSVKLPTEADAIAFAAGAECILNGKNSGLPSILVKGCVETRLPGPVDDGEAITVSMGTTGAPVAVRAWQDLEIHGLGDFEFKIPGPALNVRGLASSEDQPGLRKGAVLWQGFSPGTKRLEAVLLLHPDLEAARLPLSVSLSMIVGGTPLRPGERLSGPLRITITIRNQTGVPIKIPVGRGDPRALGSALRAIRRAVARGERPRPGVGGVPIAVPVTTPPRTTTATIEAPFRVSGSISFPQGTIAGLHVEGANERLDGATFVGWVGGGAPLSRTIAITGRARGVGLPQLGFTAEPAPPLASELDGASPSGPADGRRMLQLAMTTMWQTALTAPYEQYLGNPDPAGPSTASYRYVLAPPAPSRASAAVLPGHVRPIGVAVFTLLALGVLFALAFAWARA